MKDDCINSMQFADSVPVILLLHKYPVVHHRQVLLADIPNILGKCKTLGGLLDVAGKALPPGDSGGAPRAGSAVPAEARAAANGSTPSPRTRPRRGMWPRPRARAPRAWTLTVVAVAAAASSSARGIALASRPGPRRCHCAGPRGNLAGCRPRRICPGAVE
jgi:hypothetical protein